LRRDVGQSFGDVPAQGHQFGVAQEPLGGLEQDFFLPAYVGAQFLAETLDGIAAWFGVWLVSHCDDKSRQVQVVASVPVISSSRSGT
jgi:hypothetical protein